VSSTANATWRIAGVFAGACWLSPWFDGEWNFVSSSRLPSGVCMIAMSARLPKAAPVRHMAKLEERSASPLDAFGIELQYCKRTPLVLFGGVWVIDNGFRLHYGRLPSFVRFAAAALLQPLLFAMSLNTVAPKILRNSPNQESRWRLDISRTYHLVSSEAQKMGNLVISSSWVCFTTCVREFKDSFVIDIGHEFAKSKKGRLIRI
jgi:hypothetical protein